MIKYGGLILWFSKNSIAKKDSNNKISKFTWNVWRIHFNKNITLNQAAEVLSSPKPIDWISKKAMLQRVVWLNQRERYKCNQK